MKKTTSIFIVVLMSALSINAGEKMNSYQQKMTDRRMAEAKQLWKVMESDGFTETTVAALDFTFFSDDQDSAKKLVEALSENYTAELVPDKEDSYWLIKGTTRPYGNEFTKDQWLEWVDFMTSLGFSNNSVFSTWSVYDPKTKKNWSSESIETE